VESRVTTRHQQSQADECCPGEADCQRFQAAAGATPEEKQQACITCPLLPTKLTRTSANDEAILDRVDRLARERDSSMRPVPLDRITELEWELLLVRDECEDAYKRAHEARVAALFEALLVRSS
jgi:hypothetical protein